MQTASAKLGLAEADAAERKFDQARALAGEALDLREAFLGARHPAAAEAHEALARIALAEGDTEKARAEAEEARGIYAEALGAEHPSVARMLALEARLDQASRNYAGGRATLSAGARDSEQSLRRGFARRGRGAGQPGRFVA
ncbi:MAG: tetratricopeptide repeat protein [Bryobacterales bacterium]